jgi:hypothetical protein
MTQYFASTDSSAVAARLHTSPCHPAGTAPRNFHSTATYVVNSCTNSPRALVDITALFESLKQQQRCRKSLCWPLRFPLVSKPLIWALQAAVMRLRLHMAYPPLNTCYLVTQQSAGPVFTGPLVVFNGQQQQQQQQTLHTGSGKLACKPWRMYATPCSCSWMQNYITRCSFGHTAQQHP